MSYEEWKQKSLMGLVKVNDAGTVGMTSIKLPKSVATLFDIGVL